MSSNTYIHHKARKRVQKSSPFAASADAVCMVFSVLMPLTTLPQIIQLFTSHNATGLSLLMWILYAIGSVPFLIYGWIHKVVQLVILNMLWLAIDAIMIYGIVHFSH